MAHHQPTGCGDHSPGRAHLALVRLYDWLINRITPPNNAREAQSVNEDTAIATKGLAVATASWSTANPDWTGKHSRALPNPAQEADKS